MSLTTVNSGYLSLSWKLERAGYTHVARKGLGEGVGFTEERAQSSRLLHRRL